MSGYRVLIESVSSDAACGMGRTRSGLIAVMGGDGSLFRGRYRAILIDADEYLAAVLRYIHLNPLCLSRAKVWEKLWDSVGLLYRGMSSTQSK